MKNPVIISSCCAFGTDGTENVHVLKKDCPIGREVSTRTRPEYISVPDGVDNPVLEETACIGFSGLLGCYTVARCPHYNGVKKGTHNQRKAFFVTCSANQ